MEKHPEDVAGRTAYAISLQSIERFEQAAAQYTLVLQEEPDNLMALNNQAWIIREQNPAQALEYARKAASLAPESAEILDTLAVVEYLNKDYRHAQRTIERALQVAPDHPALMYHSAMIASALDDKAAARVTLEKLLGANSDFPEMAEAKALLAQLEE